MKYLATLLLIFGFGLSGFGQTIKSLGYNTTNGQVIANTALLKFTNKTTFGDLMLNNVNGLIFIPDLDGAKDIFFFDGGSDAPVARANLGFSTNLNSLWTATNASNARSAVGLGATNHVNFASISVNGNLEIADGNLIFVDGEVAMAGSFRFDSAVLFNNSSGTRANLGFSTNLNTLWTASNASNARSAIDVPSSFGSGPFSLIGGGESNSATTNWATAVGGFSNRATQTYATVVGGDKNIASGSRSFVGGGQLNTASGGNSIIVGGFSNRATANSSTVLGGSENLVSGANAIVAGGAYNKAGGSYSFAGGIGADAAFEGSFVWADAQFGSFPITNFFSSTNINSFNVRANGGMHLDLGGIGIVFRGTNAALAVANTRQNLGLENFPDGGGAAVASAFALWDGPNEEIGLQISDNEVTIGANSVGPFRTALGLGWSALTNTNAATSLLGFTTNGQVVANTGTNVLTFTNAPIILTRDNGDRVSINGSIIRFENQDRVNLEEMSFLTPLLLIEGTNQLELSASAATTRTNLGIPLAALTNTNVTNFRTAIEAAKLHPNGNGVAEAAFGLWDYGAGLYAMQFNNGQVFFGGNSTISNFRTSLGLGATWLTNTNVTNFRTEVGLGASNAVNFQRLNIVSDPANTTNFHLATFSNSYVGFALSILTSDEDLAAGYDASSGAIGVGGGVFQVKYGSGIYDWGWPILTKENGLNLVIESPSTNAYPSSYNFEFNRPITFKTNAFAATTRTNLGLGGGITANRTFVSYNGTNYTTNTVTISNGIITGWTQ